MTQDSSGRGHRQRRRHPGHSRRDGSPGRPAADELHGLGDLPDRAGGLGGLGFYRRDRSEAVPVRLAAGQGHKSQPVRCPVRLAGRDQHPARRLRPRLAGRQDRAAQGADLVLGAGCGVHLAVRVRDQLPGADRLVDLRHARVRRVPGHERRVHERDHGADMAAQGDAALPGRLHLPPLCRHRRHHPALLVPGPLPVVPVDADRGESSGGGGAVLPDARVAALAGGPGTPRPGTPGRGADGGAGHEAAPACCPSPI